MNEINYSNEVDSLETLPLLLTSVLTSSSESEVGLVYLRHTLPHSIINHCINKKGLSTLSHYNGGLRWCDLSLLPSFLNRNRLVDKVKPLPNTMIQGDNK